MSNTIEKRVPGVCGASTPLCTVTAREDGTYLINDARTGNEYPVDGDGFAKGAIKRIFRQAGYDWNDYPDALDLPIFGAAEPEPEEVALETTEEPNIFEMAGTEGTYRYVVLAHSERGRVGVRELGYDKFRVRVEPSEEVDAYDGQFGQSLSGWKRPGDGQRRYSLVVYKSDLESTIAMAIRALATDDEFTLNPGLSTMYYQNLWDNALRATLHEEAVVEEQQSTSSMPEDEPIQDADESDDPDFEENLAYGRSLFEQAFRASGLSDEQVAAKFEEPGRPSDEEIAEIGAVFRGVEASCPHSEQSTDVAYLQAEVHRLRHDVADLTAERDELREVANGYQHAAKLAQKVVENLRDQNERLRTERAQAESDRRDLREQVATSLRERARLSDELGEDPMVSQLLNQLADAQEALGGKDQLFETSRDAREAKEFERIALDALEAAKQLLKITSPGLDELIANLDFDVFGKDVDSSFGDEEEVDAFTDRISDLLNQLRGEKSGSDNGASAPPFDESAIRDALREKLGFGDDFDLHIIPLGSLDGDGFRSFGSEGFRD